LRRGDVGDARLDEAVVALVDRVRLRVVDDVATDAVATADGDVLNDDCSAGRSDSLNSTTRGELNTSGRCCTNNSMSPICNMLSAATTSLLHSCFRCVSLSWHVTPSLSQRQ